MGIGRGSPTMEEKRQASESLPQHHHPHLSKEPIPTVSRAVPLPSFFSLVAAMFWSSFSGHLSFTNVPENESKHRKELNECT